MQCRHCERVIVLDEDGRWIDPEAPATPEEGDDFIWRETCDANDLDRIAAHEPSTCRVCGSALDDEGYCTLPKTPGTDHCPMNERTQF